MGNNKNIYKETLNLPQTDFPMRGNLPQNEPKTIAFWKEKNIYKKILEKNKGQKLFTMPDGPPYANGDIHIGHALNKILKDIVIKYKNMRGFKASFIPGWDCHGLPIELKVGKSLGAKRKEMTNSEFRGLCRKEAQKWVDIQKEQFINLGILADWENPYLTMNSDYEAEEVRVLGKTLDNGALYRGEKPVFWCTKLQTALAAAEVEHRDHESLSIYVKFEFQGKSDLLPKDKPLSFVIWTTTPWTLPANYGICLNPNFTYGIFKKDEEYLIIAEKMKETFEKETGIKLDLIQSTEAKKLEGLEAQHPFIKDRKSKVILGDHVTLETGTGCVHTAPGHGTDDFYVGQKYGLPTYSPVDASGHYTKEVAKYAGQSIWKANDLIVRDLKESKHLLFSKKIIHSYPYNPRTKSPLIFRATPQWFIRMDEERLKLRERALQATENEIQFFPKWGKQRLQAMLQNSPDWCVSRQRTWGVPIAVFYCKSCDETLASSKIMNKVADAIEAEGLEAYHSHPVKNFIGDAVCKKCGGKEFERGQDILDVWFDSGVCHSAVQKKNDDLDYPADIYLEGSDQHRGWFQTSLLSSLAAEKKLPFKALITHGFVNDSQGLKMSKSKGNVVHPIDIIKKNGSEILRLWVAYEDYGQDVTVSEQMFARIIEAYRRIRNTMRFLLGNLYDFDPSKDQVSVKDMPLLDQWALYELNELISKVTSAYDNYNFYKAYHALNYFFTVTLSATYLDILKDRLYTSKSDGIERRSSQTVFYHLLENLVGLMAPILSFLSEEVNSCIPQNKYESVFLRSFPECQKDWNNEKLKKDMDVIFELRDQVSKELEEMRKNKEIGSSLDAQVTLTLKEAAFKSFNSYPLQHIKEIFIVSKIDIKSGKETEIQSRKANGEKCGRCWHFSEELSSIDSLENVCPKCVKAL